MTNNNITYNKYSIITIETVGWIKSQGTIGLNDCIIYRKLEEFLLLQTMS